MDLEIISLRYITQMTTNFEHVTKWRNTHPELHRERNKLYSNRSYAWKIISATFRNIDPSLFL